MRVLFGYLFIFLLLFTTKNTFGGSDKDIDKIDDPFSIARIVNKDIEVYAPSIIFAFKPVEIRLKFINPKHNKLLLNNNKIHFIINGEDVELLFTDGVASFTHKFNEDKTLSIYVEEFSYNKDITAFPLWALLTPVGLVIIWLIGRTTRKRKRRKKISAA